ncbi:MAG: TonB family protein [Massilia sp.]
MHFSAINNDNGSKVTKIAVVGLFHLVLAVGLIKATGLRDMVRAKPPVFIDVPPEVLKAPVVEPTPAPSEPMQKQPPLVNIDEPVIDIAKPVVDTQPKQPPGPPAVVDSGKPSVEPTITTGGGGTGTSGGSGAQGKMRTAVLADGCALPEYPSRSARNNETGTVTLALLVSAGGKVVESRIQTSSGYRDLDKAAQAALSMCKFKAATNGGVAEQGWSQIAYVWSLD